jgi:PQQ-dependent dehydrogenase (methanol/ethanol family)
MTAGIKRTIDGMRVGRLGALACGILLVFLSAGTSRLWAQNASAPMSKADAKQTYLKLCSGCHGVDARGSQQAPGLAENAALHGRSARWLQRLIHNGVPGAGMPAFDLPDNTLEGLAALIQSLNASAAETAVPGDRAAGEQYFFGPGKCASCHMIAGRGEAVGPDLSDVAKDHTVGQIREKLLHPDEDITPGYELATVRLQDGQTLRGFIRDRTNFSIELQDLSGGFHSLSLDGVAETTEEKNSLMPAVEASSGDLQNLLAYLSQQAGVQPGAHPTGTGPAKGGVTFAEIEHPKPGEWLTYNGNLNGNRYSELTQINRSNVSRLGLKWSFSIPLWKRLLPDIPYFRENMRYFGLETVPLVVDGMMYVTGPNQAYALDARTGHEIWQFVRPRTPGVVGDAAVGANRGLAVLGDKVFMVTDNAHLVALNRITGRPVWEVTMPDEAQHYGGTLAPLIVKDMVIAGVAGGDWGIRGFVAAYKADSGERVWRHWTIPAQGEPGYDTWKGSSVSYGGGGTWLTGSYDPETDTLYWSTGNPWPDSDDRQRGGDNLYTDSVLALDPASGAVKWYYQFTPHDTHDWDSLEPNVLIDTKYHGEQRKLLLHADRNGFFYVLDRTNGHVLLSRPFVHDLNWASGIGPDGRPVRLPTTNETCPESATNWNGTAYNPETRMYYVMAVEKCDINLSPSSGTTTVPKDVPGVKYMRALDIDTGAVRWEIREVGATDGKRDAGVVATAGGLLLYGDPSGSFVAVDDRTGKALWHFPANGLFKTSPMTYRVDGEQYVAIAVGSTVMCFGLVR